LGADVPPGPCRARRAGPVRELWSHYLLLVAVEEAFKNLKGDLDMVE
jgi:hypothetical protein